METLPKGDILSIRDFEFTEKELQNHDFMEEYLLDYLSGKYGYCIFSFQYDYDNNYVYVNNIMWDTSE